MHSSFLYSEYILLRRTVRYAEFADLEERKSQVISRLIINGDCV
jgi:hypothetical protein